MMEKLSLRNFFLLFIALMFYILPIKADIIWPGLFVTQAIFKTWFLIFISIIIEAIFFLLFIKNISFLKSLLLSIVGNLISFIIGSIVTAILVFYFTVSLFQFFNVEVLADDTFINYVVTIIIMYLGTVFIELISLKLIVEYSAKKLLVPILIGNLITYILAILFGLSII